MSDALVNRVTASGLITLKPEEWAPSVLPQVFDLKEYLFMALILKEQDFRDSMKAHDWAQYKDKVLCILCSTDAIIPSWGYMLVATMATPFTKEVFFGTPDQWVSRQLLQYIEQLDLTPYADQRVIIKGCSDHVAIGPEIYVALTGRLVPVVKSLMFGEPCSTVPVFKRSKGA
ncbi:MAG: DUF2480 family protein [Saprospiraceae bacterium]|nr:DUF2480 family protein [Saprospiraceae bacterium]